MDIKEKELARNELIGMKVKIKKCNDPNWEGKKGLVIDETKNTFLIKIEKEEKRIAKKSAIFEFEYEDEKISLNGSDIIYKPEDRIKKIR